MIAARKPVPVAVSALVAIVLWFALGPLTVILPTSGLDGSYNSVLGHAWISGWQWGVDVIDNFGPYGFLDYREFHPQTIVTMLALNGALAAVLAAAWVALVRNHSIAFQILTSILLTFAISIRPDLFCFALPVILAFAHFREPSPVALAIRVALIFATALVCLVKWTFLAEALGIVVILDLDNIRRRRWPWYVIGTVGAIGMFYLAAGQHLENLGPFITLTFDQTAGFSEAMALTGPVWEILFYLGACGLIAVWLVYDGLIAQRKIWRTLCVGLICAGIAFVMFKVAFVRHHSEHVVTAWGGLIFIALGYEASVATGATTWRLSAAVGFAIAMLTITYFTLPHVIRTFGPESVANMVSIVTDWTGWKAGMETKRQAIRAEIRRSLTLPKLEGVVDTIPPLQAHILAYGFDYRGHPTMQEHQAYTPKTLEADAAFFRSSRAPDYLLFLPGSIDERYPTLTEGALWPLFLSRYKPDRLLGTAQWPGDVVILKRRDPATATVILGPPINRAASWDEWIDLPRDWNATFAHIRIRSRLLGTLVGVLFRPARIAIEVRLADGSIQYHRLPRGLAEAGFVLSPYMTTGHDYVALASDNRDALAPKQVTAFRLVARWQATLRPQFEYDLAPLDVTPVRAEPPAP